MGERDREKEKEIHIIINIGGNHPPAESSRNQRPALPSIIYFVTIIWQRRYDINFCGSFDFPLFSSSTLIALIHGDSAALPDRFDPNSNACTSLNTLGPHTAFTSCPRLRSEHANAPRLSSLQHPYYCQKIHLIPPPACPRRSHHRPIAFCLYSNSPSLSLLRSQPAFSPVFRPFPRSFLSASRSERRVSRIS